MDVSSIQNALSPAAPGGSKVERSPAGGPASEKAVTGERASSQAAEEESTAVTREDVEAAVATIQDFVQSVRRNINFSLEEGSGRVVVKVTDQGSGDLIRQIPSEEALQLAENLSEVRSLLFKAEA
ncbi:MULTISPECIES: flagellar protein FlaG [Pseudomonas]|uniref:flagellar protein FlaG n=1 Tax=Pseudomonas TaxID=286 RepID=UPI001C7FC738|nr:MULTISPECIES: flagellar protein FlaG [Pseudomonas]MDG9927139.1 flagellar protein FlaG [Pseudomonas sp. GD04042]MDH0482852.1 flagellar protein FlaG [Pseudomonas sp. GD04015]MDH0602554.1 flagellar protein FlaG [Pseudomonas sp. GD03869]MDH0893173.1 flagellar protein FlaG [Pseudomonas sp. GD03875]MDH1063006.1 flagellar protein FlaG [Pseudomonas sp. GD03985]